MPYLSHYPHAAFVSYAHSELNVWSAGFVEHLQRSVAFGLKLRDVRDLPFWFDTQFEGNVPLTAGLKQAVENAACLIVLLSEEFLESSWCTNELDWFTRTIESKREHLSHPVFIVLLHDIPREQWPKPLRDLDLVGYPFEGDRVLRTPLGYSRARPPEGPEYENALRKLAGQLITHLKQVKEEEIAPRPSHDAPRPPPDAPPPPPERSETTHLPDRRA